MEDDRRLVLLEHLAPHRLRVANVDELRYGSGEVALVHELALDVEQRGLGDVDEDEPRRPDACDLAAQLGPDGAAGAGDEHGLILEVGGNALEVDLDLLAAEDVLHLDRPDLTGEVEVAGDELVQARERLHRDVCSLRGLDHLAAHLARGGRDGDQHLVGLVLAHEARQLAHRPENADAEDARVPLALVVVDEADRRVREQARALHLLDDQAARVTGPDDDDLLAASDDAAARSLHHRACEQPCAGDECERDEEVGGRDRARQPHVVHRRGEIDGDVGDERRDDNAARGAPHVAHRDVTPPAAVEAEEQEHRHLDDDDEQDRPPQQRVVVDRQPVVEAQLEREEPRDGDDRRIGQDLQEAGSTEAGHARAPTPTAERTTSTTRSCASTGMPGHSGTEKFSSATCSVFGSEPGSLPRKRSAGWRWSGVV